MQDIIGFCGRARAGKDTSASVMKELIDKDHSCYRYSLADPIKQQINKVFGWNDRHGYGDLKEEVTTKVISTKDVRRMLYESFDDLLEGKGIKTPDGVRRDYSVGALANIWHWVMMESGVIKKQWKLTDCFMLEIKASPRMMYQLHGTDFARNCISDSIWFDIADSLRKSREGVMLIPDIRFPNEADWVMKSGGALVGVKSNVNSKIDSSNHDSEKHIDKVLDKCAYILHNEGTLEDLSQEVLEVYKALV